jgi:hypothetical protein
MKVFGFIIALSIVLAGYMSAAHAFGMPNCPHHKMAAQHMHHCDMSGKGKPMSAHCAKGDCCPAAAPVIEAQAMMLAAPLAVPSDALPMTFVITNIVYPQLRPPNALA